MRQIALILMALMVAPVVIGCGDSGDEPTATGAFADGASLLGLTRDHELNYQVYDSTVTYDPQMIHYDTTDMRINVLRGRNDQVRLSLDGVAHDLLTIDALGVLHSGQIRPNANPVDTVFFYPTPVIMPRTLQGNSSWNILSPPFVGPLGAERRTLLFLNYGYYTVRKFLGRSDVILPGRSYEAYHCRLALFLTETSVDTQMVVDEYYSLTVGLVKLESQAPGRGRRIILIEDH
ncbi:MAG: hypothetical protein PHR28_02600 [candidate division Zixibacteria bacterium]|nr:hypothetical protein [candidate division Zixibacteria bacterium]